jgi:hypothetical protein
MRALPRLALGALWVTALAGCGAGSGAVSGPGPSLAATSVATPAAGVAARTLELQIAPYPGRAIRGTATVDIKATGGYLLTVTLTGLTPAAVHRVNVHAGTCASEDTTTLIQIGFAQADAAGAGKLAVPFPGVYSVPAGGRILTVHGPNGTGDELGHLACADMTP